MTKPPSIMLQIGQILSLALVYAALGLAGMQLPAYVGHFTLLWLPAGFAVAALWRGGLKLWPGVSLGSLLISFAYNDLWPMGTFNALANTAGTIACAWLLRRGKFDPSFQNLRDLLVLGGSALGGMLLCASLGSLSHFLVGQTGIAELWLTWWQSDTTGVLLLTPVLLTADADAWKTIRGRPWEFLLWADLTLALVGLHFWNTSLPLLFLTAIPLVWAAMRFGRFGTALGIFLLGGGGILSVALGRGQLALTDPQSGLLLVSVYLVGVVLLGWLVYFLKAELSESEARYQRAERATEEGLWEWNLLTGEDYCSPRWLEILGYGPGDLPPTFAAISQLIHPDDLPRVMAESDESIRARRPFRVEMRMRRKSGDYLWVLSRGRIEQGADGKPVRMTGSISDITKRRQEEAMRVKSEARYQRAERATGDGLWERNLATDEEYRSPRWLEILGYGPHDLALNYEAISGLFHPDDRDLAIAVKDSCLRDGKPVSVEARMRRKDGAYVWVWARAWVEVDAAGKAVYMTGAITDISVRKQAEAALLASEDLLQRTGAMAKVGAWELDVQTMQPFWSLETFRIHEVDPPVTPPLDRAIEFYAPAVRPTIMAAVRAAIDHGTPWDLELPLITAKGRPIWVRTQSTTVMENGKAIKLRGAFHDITERREAEMALRESEHLNRALLSAIPDLILTNKRDGEYLAVQAADPKLLFLPPAQFLNRKVGEILPAPVADQFLQGFATALDSATVQELNYSLPFPAGQEKHFEARLVPHTEDTVISIVRDITERRQAEAALDALKGQTRQIQHAESLNRMAGAIAHHFNNQLQVVMGHLELALQDLPPDIESRENLAEAMSSARKATEVSGLMLTYLGQETAEGEPLDLAALAREVLAQLGPVTPEAIRVEAYLPLPGPAITATAKQVQQVLNSLLKNAWEATGEKGGAVRVRLQTVAAVEISALNRWPVDWRPLAPAYACLEVADAGEGIAPENIEKLFEPFFSTKFIGRGLGLPTTLGIVRSCHGCITVESRTGAGSVFRVFLPTSTKSPAPKLAPPARTRETIAGCTVLVVEDEPSVRRVISFALQRAGLTVVEAEDGFEAVELFRQHGGKIDCVLCDVTMPRMNGWETLLALRALAPDLPVILASGYTEAEVMAGDHPERPQAFLYKPFEVGTLISTVNRVLTATG